MTQIAGHTECFITFLPFFNLNPSGPMWSPRIWQEWKFLAIFIDPGSKWSGTFTIESLLRLSFISGERLVWLYWIGAVCESCELSSVYSEHELLPVNVRLHSVWTIFLPVWVWSYHMHLKKRLKGPTPNLAVLPGNWYWICGWRHESHK